MSTPTLTVRRFTTTSHLAGDRAEDAARVEAIARGVAGRRLEWALAEAGLPEGIWCIRRLDVPVRLDLDRPDPALEAAWAAALVGAVRRALATGSPGVVRYERERDAVADLVAGAATGDLARAWAWARLGLTAPGDPPADRAPGAAIVAALRSRPELALGCVLLAARRAGVAALHRALGPRGWADVAAVVLAAVGGPPDAAPPPGGRTAPAQARAPAALAGVLVAASELADLVRASRLRPDPVTLDAWALLVVAEADASAPGRQSGAQLFAAVARLLAGGTGAAPPPPPTGQAAAPAGQDQGTRPPAPHPAAPAAPRGGAAPRRPTGQDRHPGPTADPDAARPGEHPALGATAAPAGRAAGTRADADERPATAPPGAAGAGHATSWAGLLFLLATAAEAGVPGAILDDEVFDARPLPWALQGVALRLLPVEAGDPAVAAFAGVDAAAPPPWVTGRAAGAEERERLAGVATRWAAVTAEALGPGAGDPVADPAAVVVTLARRRGRVEHSPGWIDVHLELDEVDVAVRLAGLDLDPGWVPWLGTVVRFVYG
jgi:hypothetical protein